MLESPILKVLIIAMIPIGELRAALPLALTHYHIPLVTAFFASVVGNLLPVVLIVFLLEPVSTFLMEKSRFFNWFFNKLFHYTRHKHSKKFEKLEELALVTFVAIPLPMTGAWSGALAAFVFGIPPKKALPLIALGVAIAGVIVAIATLGVKAVL